MRALFLVAAGDPAAERLWRVAHALDQRGHCIRVLAPAGTAELAPFPVQEGVWHGWRGAYAAGRTLVEHDVELAVAGDSQGLGFLRWARLLHPATVVSALGADDGGTAERELEAVRAAHVHPHRAVFLDRDGTLMPEMGALGRPEAVRLMPGVGPAMRALAAAHYQLVVVSNQAAIGRGAITMEQATAVNAELRRALRVEGVELSGIFICPHRPEDGCDCRKPLPGLLLQAATALHLSLKACWLIGDSTRDTGAAEAAGVRAILLPTGWGGGDPAAEGSRVDGKLMRVRDINEAVKLILR